MNLTAGSTGTSSQGVGKQNAAQKPWNCGAQRKDVLWLSLESKRYYMVYCAWNRGYYHSMFWGAELKELFLQHGSFEQLEVQVKKKSSKLRGKAQDGGWYTKVYLESKEGWTKILAWIHFPKPHM